MSHMRPEDCRCTVCQWKVSFGDASSGSESPRSERSMRSTPSSTWSSFSSSCGWSGCSACHGVPSTCGWSDCSACHGRMSQTSQGAGSQDAPFNPIVNIFHAGGTLNLNLPTQVGNLSGNYFPMRGSRPNTARSPARSPATNDFGALSDQQTRGVVPGGLLGSPRIAADTGRLVNRANPPALSSGMSQEGGNYPARHTAELKDELEESVNEQGNKNGNDQENDRNENEPGK